MKKEITKRLLNNTMVVADPDLCVLYREQSRRVYEFWMLKCNSDDKENVTEEQKEYVNSLYNEESCCYDTNKFLNDVRNELPIAIEIAENLEWWLHELINLDDYDENELDEYLLGYLSPKVIMDVITDENSWHNYIGAKLIFLGDCEQMSNID